MDWETILSFVIIMAIYAVILFVIKVFTKKTPWIHVFCVIGAFLVTEFTYDSDEFFKILKHEAMWSFVFSMLIVNIKLFFVGTKRTIVSGSFFFSEAKEELKHISPIFKRKKTKKESEVVVEEYEEMLSESSETDTANDGNLNENSVEVENDRNDEE
jgi:hypothetical protein